MLLIVDRKVIEAKIKAYNHFVDFIILFVCGSVNRHRQPSSAISLSASFSPSISLPPLQLTGSVIMLTAVCLLWYFSISISAFSLCYLPQSKQKAAEAAAIHSPLISGNVIAIAVCAVAALFRLLLRSLPQLPPTLPQYLKQ